MVLAKQYHYHCWSIVGLWTITESINILAFNQFSWLEQQTHKPKFCVKPLLDAFKGIEDDSGIQVQGLLGTDFLLENQWIIDFKELKLMA